MRSARILACSALTLCALGLPATAAGADESDVSVSPQRAFPGSTITVSTEVCGPDVTYAKGQAEAGGQINLTKGHGSELVGDFTVPETAEDGEYTITVKCPPRTRVETSFQVVSRPEGAVRGGFGGAGGVNGTQIVVGSLLIAGAAAGGAVTMRRRRFAGIAS
ncbi:hypothetical protein AB0K02_12985 [Streptomyces sp. NPDC049597]|uniref:hypothetical protein n=1 Tax=Streptomyces sp. NPDC049597 TaxID=3155276 RepID=UPI0034147DB5